MEREVGRYRVVEELGRGGMGVVYRARDPRTGRDVALKLLNGPELTEERCARFQREAEAASRLRHPQVVRVHDAGIERGRPFIVMELLEGESLQQRLDREGPLPVREAAELVRVLAEGVQRAHDEGVIHRDLKPDNVRFDERGAPKLTDFGLAKDLVASEAGPTKTGQWLGTPGFMAPEQLRRAQDVDARADVYGLGATLFAALTGEAPVEGGSPMELMGQILNAPPPSPAKRNRHVPSDLDAICRRCMAKAPEDRYASAQALADDLAEVVRGQRLAWRRGARRRRALTALALVGAGVCVWAWRRAEVARARASVVEAAEARAIVWSEFVPSYAQPWPEPPPPSVLAALRAQLEEARDWLGPRAVAQELQWVRALQIVEGATLPEPSKGETGLELAARAWVALRRGELTQAVVWARAADEGEVDTARFVRLHAEETSTRDLVAFAQSARGAFGAIARERADLALARDLDALVRRTPDPDASQALAQLVGWGKGSFGEASLRAKREALSARAQAWGDAFREEYERGRGLECLRALLALLEREPALETPAEVRDALRAARVAIGAQRGVFTERDELDAFLWCDRLLDEDLGVTSELSQSMFGLLDTSWSEPFTVTPAFLDTTLRTGRRFEGGWLFEEVAQAVGRLPAGVAPTHGGQRQAYVELALEVVNADPRRMLDPGRVLRRPGLQASRGLVEACRAVLHTEGAPLGSTYRAEVWLYAADLALEDPLEDPEPIRARCAGGVSGAITPGLSFLEPALHARALARLGRWEELEEVLGGLLGSVPERVRAVRAQHQQVFVHWREEQWALLRPALVERGAWGLLIATAFDELSRCPEGMARRRLAALDPVYAAGEGERVASAWAEVLGRASGETLVALHAHRVESVRERPEWLRRYLREASAACPGEEERWRAYWSLIRDY